MIVTALLFSLLLSVEVMAQEGDEIRLDETGMVTLTSQEAAKAGVSSLQIGLQVDSAEGEKVEFIFAESNAKILEFRYDGNAKQWNLYLAGTEELFAEGSDTLTLGRVAVLNGNGEAATATLSVPENSAWYVYGTELRSIESLKLPESVVINARETDFPGAADGSEGTGTGSQGTTGSGTTGTGSQGTTGSGTTGNGSQGGSEGSTTTTGNGSQGESESNTETEDDESQGESESNGTTGNSTTTAGNKSNGTTGSGTGTAGNKSQATGSGTGTVGNESKETTGSGTETAGNGNQGTESGSQGAQSISPTFSTSSDAQSANAEAAEKGSEKKAAGISRILAILLVAAFGVAAAVLMIRVMNRRR